MEKVEAVDTSTIKEKLDFDIYAPKCLIFIYSRVKRTSLIMCGTLKIVRTLKAIGKILNQIVVPG